MVYGYSETREFLLFGSSIQMLNFFLQCRVYDNDMLVGVLLLSLEVLRFIQGKIYEVSFASLVVLYQSLGLYWTITMPSYTLVSEVMVCWELGIKMRLLDCLCKIRSWLILVFRLHALLGYIVFLRVLFQGQDWTGPWVTWTSVWLS